jgi:hypothetical protein
MFGAQSPGRRACFGIIQTLESSAVTYLRMDADTRAYPIDDDQVRLVVEVFRMLAD